MRRGRGRSRAVCAAVVFVLGVSGCVVVRQGEPSGAVVVSEAPPPEEPPQGGEGVPAEQAMARDVFDRVNAERTGRGLAPVGWSGDLAAVARDWAREMAARGVLEHQDVGQLLKREDLSGFRSIGENIFRSTGPVTSGQVHVGWMRSDGHRGNVLEPGWDRLGVGFLCAEDGSVWAVQEFGRTVDADLPPVSGETPPLEPIARPGGGGPTCP